MQWLRKSTIRGNYMILQTYQDWKDALQQFTCRAIIREECFLSISVSVPFYCVKKVKSYTDINKPVGLKVIVKRLSWWQHLVMWEIRHQIMFKGF